MESLCNQTYREIEIVLVDDGAKDSSGKMCDDWAAKDNRVKVVHKENAGLGYARNSGIDVATGTYVAYVDSDDYIVEDAIEKVVKRLEETGADICYFGCIDVCPDSKSYGTPPKKLLYTEDETIEYVKMILGPSADSTDFLFGGVSAWSGIVKKYLLDSASIRFPSERECLCEDVFYNIKVCMNAKCIAVEPSCLYCYCHNDNSLTTRYRDDRFDAAKRMYYSLGDIVSDAKSDPEISERMYRAFMQNIIVCVKQELIYKEPIGQKKMKQNLKAICNDELVVETMHNYPINRLPIKQRLLFSAIKYKLILVIELLVGVRIKKGVRG